MKKVINLLTDLIFNKKKVCPKDDSTANIILSNYFRHCEPARAWQSISILISENLKIVIKEITGLLSHFVPRKDGKSLGLLRRFVPRKDGKYLGLLRFARNDEKLRKKVAFTLAEVLITVAIVGVVSILILPILNKKIQQQQTLSRLKQVYSVTQQAIKLSEIENGDMNYWTSSGNVFFERYLKNYLSVISIARLNIDGTHRRVTYKGLNGITNRSAGWWVFRNPSYIYILKNGASIITAPGSNTGSGMEYWVDINGWEKPNILGKDLFCFYLSSKKGLVPCGYYNSGECTFAREPNTDIEVLTGKVIPPVASNGCKLQPCAKNLTGGWCAALIMTQNWKITKDYPW